MKPCTCTIACIPQGITEEQTCRLQIDEPNELDIEMEREFAPDQPTEGEPCSS